MSLSNLVSNGGKVLVVGGYSKSWDSYKDNPQLEFWSGEQRDIVRYLRDKTIPANCKAIIISRFISHSELGKVMTEARQRNITMFPNKADGEISTLLDEITHDQPKPMKITKLEGRGKLKNLIQFIDWNKTNTENARILITKAKNMGIESTENSLANFVGVQRRKVSGGAIVKSVRSKLDVSVEMLDVMIKDLSGMRDFLIEITEENRILKSKLDKFKKVFESD